MARHQWTFRQAALLGALASEVAPPGFIFHAGLFSGATPYALPFFCYRKQRVRPLPRAVMETYENTRSGIQQRDESAVTIYSRQLFVVS